MQHLRFFLVYHKFAGNQGNNAQEIRCCNSNVAVLGKCAFFSSRLAHFSHDITGSNVCQRPSQATDESSRILKNAIKPPKQCAIEKTLRWRFYLWRNGTVYFENSNNWHKLTVFHLPFYLPFARIYLPFWEKTCFTQNTPGNEIQPSAIGRGDRTRTCGILLPKQALYQTELHLERTNLVLSL